GWQTRISRLLSYFQKLPAFLWILFESLHFLVVKFTENFHLLLRRVATDQTLETIIYHFLRFTTGIGHRSLGKNSGRLHKLRVIQRYQCLKWCTGLLPFYRTKMSFRCVKI